ncbi:MAG: hypothetical protein Q9190_006506 [Brigantiaea leucoxantha]
MSAFTHQPLKLLWTVVTVLHCLFRLPLLSLYYIPRATRQHPAWTFRQAIGCDILKLWFTYASYVEFKFPLSVDSAAEAEQWVTIKPSSQRIYHRIPHSPATAIQPAIIGGTWFPRPYHVANDVAKKIILHFHGGGYVLSGTRRSECGFAASNLCKGTSSFVFFPQYRLASSPDCGYPAAFQDALTSYAYLLDLGIPSTSIVISGDSAGGHLAIMLLRYLSENSGLLPHPLAVLLWSPWLDLAADPKEIDRNRNSRTDFVPAVFVNWAVKAFVPPDMELTNPYLSPAHHPFFTDTPIWIQVGGLEVLNDEIHTFERNMVNIQQNRVKLYEVANAPHDILMAGNILGFEAQVASAANLVGNFLASLAT